MLASKVALSSDGSVLAAAETGLYFLDQTDRTVRFYSLPSMTAIGSMAPTANCDSTPYISDFTLSGSGTEVGLLLASSGDCQFDTSNDATEVSHIDGSNNLALAPPTGAQLTSAPLLSPDGALASLAFTDGSGTGGSIFGTAIYKNGLIVATLDTATVAASAEGWIDNNDLLAANAEEVCTPPQNYPCGWVSSSGSTIYNA